MSQILVPPSPTVGVFEEIVRPLRQQMDANGAESRTLADLRDTLLPKLMSGEVRVRDVERAVEGVT
ncbi:MAG: type I restriction endonuclease subunit S [Dehalococcoidia bacterium]